ncbi:hypothetical protein CVT24_009820, partial [Panaeolus cyanescens]
GTIGLTPLWDYIQGYVPCPDPDREPRAYRHWMSNDRMARLYIDSAMDLDEAKAMNVRDIKPATALWATLQAKYENLEDLYQPPEPHVPDAPHQQPPQHQQQPILPPTPPPPPKRSDQIASVAANGTISKAERLQLAVQEAREAAIRRKQYRDGRQAARTTKANFEQLPFQDVDDPQSLVSELEALFTSLNVSSHSLLTHATISGIRDSIEAFNSSIDDDESDPKTWKEARESHDADKWIEGDAAEVKSLQDMGVFKWVPRTDVPAGYKLLRPKRVFKRKRDENGTVVRH